MFDGLAAAVAETAKQIQTHGVRTVSVADELDYVVDNPDIVAAVKELMVHFGMEL